METERKPPQNAHELLARYASGERIFTGVSLPGVDLRNVTLRGAELIGASMPRARLAKGNLHRVDLSESDLSEADLSRADLVEASFFQTNLSHAKLVGIDGTGTDFYQADLSSADFTGAQLSAASLDHADLSLASFRRADLVGTTFYRSNVSGAKFAEARLHSTRLLDMDVSSLIEAEPPVVHAGPTTVDYQTIVRSLTSPGLKNFLQRTGMPEVFVEYMIDCARSLDPGGVFRLLQSTFISYGGPDTAFAQQLNDALLKNGVATFFFAKDAIPGKKLHRLMREGVNQHDRVILVCSQASLDRPGVLNEVTETLQREARDGGKEYLIPITLDDYVFSGWKPEDPGVAQAIRDRVVADFKGAETDSAKFNEGLLRLVAALKK